MARLYDDLHERFDEHLQGKLVVQKCQSNCVEVFYVPSPEKLKHVGLDPNRSTECRAKLLTIDVEGGSLTIFPTNTRGTPDTFLKPKYNQVKSISLMDGVLAYASASNNGPSTPVEIFVSPFFGATRTLTPEEAETLSDIDVTAPSTSEEVMTVLEELPSTFIKDYDYGLGLRKEYRFIVEAVEKLSDCTEIVISRTHETEIDQKTFYISAHDFEEARKTLNNITSIGRTAVQSVKKATAYNILAERIGRDEIPVTTGRHPLRKLFTAAMKNEEPLTEIQQEVVISAVTKNARSIAETSPEKLMKLQNDIELVTLERLIRRYEEMIGQRLHEMHWQNFFDKNPFILNLAFGYPIILIQEQASVGGRRLSGSGDKITDFLLKNSLSNNSAIFEIKTPQAPLLNRKSFRHGVYPPSSELSGAINQTLDQKHQFQTHIASIKTDSRIYDLESYSVHCCLIIGIMPSGEDRRKSFELFRGNSKDVEIVTFDELLEKLKLLRDFLNSSDKVAEMGPTPFAHPAELPF